MKYCRAKKATEKLKILAEYKISKNEIKMKTRQAKKYITRIYSKKIKQIYQKLGKLFALLSMWEEKLNLIHASENIMALYFSI